MQSGNIRRIYIIAGLISLTVSYFGIWLRFINDPVERTGSDFIAFYTAGRIAQTQGAARVYDPLLQQQIQQEEVGFPLAPGQVLLYNHLPYLIPIQQMLVSTTYVTSFYRWIVVLITLYIAGALVLSRALNETGIDRISIFIAAAGAILFLPVFFSLMNGQDTALLFLGAALWMYGLLSGKEYVAGLGLSLTTVRPHMALFLAIPMLFHSIRVFGIFLLGSGILALLSVVILGMDGTQGFINILLISTGGEWYGMKESAMFNLIGLLTRTGLPLEPGVIRLSGWITYIIGMACVCLLWWKAAAKKNLPIGVTVILTLVFAPHLHFHDLALLLIPIYDLVKRSKEPGNLKTAIAVTVPTSISLLLLISNISPYLQYTIPYLIMLVLAAYPYCPRLRMPLTTPHRS